MLDTAISQHGYRGIWCWAGLEYVQGHYDRNVHASERHGLVQRHNTWGMCSLLPASCVWLDACLPTSRGRPSRAGIALESAKAATNILNARGIGLDDGGCNFTQCGCV